MPEIYEVDLRKLWMDIAKLRGWTARKSELPGFDWVVQDSDKIVRSKINNSTEEDAWDSAWFIRMPHYDWPNSEHAAMLLLDDMRKMEEVTEITIVVEPIGFYISVDLPEDAQSVAYHANFATTIALAYRNVMGWINHLKEKKDA